MAPQNILITGANRGIGLELVKQLFKLKPKTIIATCRTRGNAQELLQIEKDSSVLKVINLDVNSEETVKEARRQTEEILGDSGLNLLINNAAIYVHCSSIINVDVDEMMRSYRANVVGPALMCREFVPLLRRAATDESLDKFSWEKAAIINISSDSGSVTENNDADHYNYGPTKAALNMLTKTMSLELKPSGILVAAVHPGWVKTDMTGPEAEITTEESVTGILKVLPTLIEKHSGKLYEYTGREMPW